MAVCVLKSNGRSEEPWWCNDDDDDDEDGKNKSTTQITRNNVSYKTSLFVSTLLEEIFSQI